MIKSAKDICNKLLELSVIAAQPKDDKEIEEKRTQRMARKEIINFLMYLSASDGSIEEDESDFIKECFDERISPEEICQRIEDDNLYSSAFEQKVPLILKKIIKHDNKVYRDIGELEVSNGETYICLYEALGNAFIICDREASPSEKDDLATYIGNMRSFYVANYSGPDDATEKGHIEPEIKPNTSQTARNQINYEDPDTSDREETLEELLEELNSLIGLSEVKSTVGQLIHFDTIKQIRIERGINKFPMTMHMVFYGNPGTGKTTVARLIGKIYHKLGILSKGHLVEVDRSGLVAGYVGHTALKVNEVVKKAKGGVLFIDEAYALTFKRSENDFGWEAVDTLTKAMEDYRDDMVIIVAGYPQRMMQFLDSNPGFRSRFNRFIKFRGYNGEELFQIYKKMLKDTGFTATEETLESAEIYMEEAYESKGENFANARLVRNYLESSIFNQADRLYGIDKDELTNEQLCAIEYDDIKNIM